MKLILFVLISSLFVSCQDEGGSPEEALFEEKQEELEVLKGKLKSTQKMADEMKVASPKTPLEELKREFEEKAGALKALGEELSLQSRSEREAREQLEEFTRKFPEWGNSAPLEDSGEN